jgi:hypothetical protein
LYNFLSDFDYDEELFYKETPALLLWSRDEIKFEMATYFEKREPGLFVIFLNSTELMGVTASLLIDLNRLC